MADELRIGLSELLPKAMIDHDAGFLKEALRPLWHYLSPWLHAYAVDAVLLYYAYARSCSLPPFILPSNNRRPRRWRN